MRKDESLQLYIVISITSPNSGKLENPPNRQHNGDRSRRTHNSPQFIIYKSNLDLEITWDCDKSRLGPYVIRMAATPTFDARVSLHVAKVSKSVTDHDHLIGRRLYLSATLRPLVTECRSFNEQEQEQGQGDKFEKKVNYRSNYNRLEWTAPT
ncbi:hypothetical protein Scep_004574 [Stephania cephalantha]|uniref:Uncharacterized protein n=1 Tax=Stephania cephalantha TaxID=152367 RepID=A0AAP0KTM0_9MAGN